MFTSIIIKKKILSTIVPFIIDEYKYYYDDLWSRLLRFFPSKIRNHEWVIVQISYSALNDNVSLILTHILVCSHVSHSSESKLCCSAIWYDATPGVAGGGELPWQRPGSREWCETDRIYQSYCCCWPLLISVRHRPTQETLFLLPCFPVMRNNSVWYESVWGWYESAASAVDSVNWLLTWTWVISYTLLQRRESREW